MATTPAAAAATAAPPVRAAPPAIARADGVHVIDAEGRRYLDGVAALGGSVHGHRVAELDAAVRAQLEAVAAGAPPGLDSAAARGCAEELARVAPAGLHRVFLSGSGTTALDLALRLAIRYHELRGEPARTAIVGLRGGVPGEGAAVERAPQPYCYRCPVGQERFSCHHECADELEALVAARRGTIAAVVVEPLVQVRGVVTQPKGYLRRLRELCDREGALLVCDEGATGLGRTGTMFACEQEKAVPDLLTVGSALAGGYASIGATLASERVVEPLPAADGSEAGPAVAAEGPGALACAAAAASLRLFREWSLLKTLPSRIGALARALLPVRQHPRVGDVRQRGLLAGIEVVRDPATAARYPAAARAGERVQREARRLGALVGAVDDVVMLLPPLAMGDAQLAELADVAHRAIDRATAELDRELPDEVQF
jgi:adenosylmethionine-8-amino-7-oxononanoate aminotransferase